MCANVIVWFGAATFGEVSNIRRLAWAMGDDFWRSTRTLTHDDKLLVKPAYQGVVDRGARLASLATSKPLGGNSELESRRDEQAVDDILLFAIYARRLIERTNTKNLAQNVSVTLWDVAGSYSDIKFVLRSDMISLWRFLGVVIHHELIKVIRTQFDAKLFFGADIDHMIPHMLLDSPVSSIEPKFVVKSDKSEIYIVDGLQFINVFQEKILGGVVDYCAESGLFLGVYGI